MKLFQKTTLPWIPGDRVRARRLGIRYAQSAGLLALGAVAGCFFHSGWWALLFWPALCFAAVAGGYLGLGPGVFQKTSGMGPRAGTRPFASRILLAPYEYLAKIYRRKYKTILPKAAEVVPGIWIGAFPKELPVSGCGILDLTAEYVRPQVCSKEDGKYAAVPLLDLLPPGEAELEEALRYLERLRQNGPVLVHCALGMTRSALVISCALVRDGICKDIREAVKKVEFVRPCLVISETAAAAAENFITKKPHLHS